MELELTVECPECGNEVKIAFSEVYPGNAKACSCGCEIRFEGDDLRNAQAAYNEVEQSLEDLGQQIKKFGKS